MAASPTVPLSPSQPANGGETQAASARARMSTRNRLLFFLTAWLLVLMPFLFWWSTWFGRPLTDQKMSEYLNDNNHPRHIQHALVQLGQRMGQHDASVSRWYGNLVRLASHPREEVRNTDAWVMGQDTVGAGFHDTLLKMLDDPSLVVRGNAALSLVRFGDSSGRAQLVSLLQPVASHEQRASSGYRNSRDSDSSRRPHRKDSRWATNVGSAISGQRASSRLVDCERIERSRRSPDRDR